MLSFPQHQPIVIDLSDLSDDGTEFFSNEEEEQVFDLMKDTVTFEDETTRAVLPKIKMQHIFKTSKPSIKDIKDRKKQSKMLELRSRQAELTWQYYIFFTICEPTWVLWPILRSGMFYSLYCQRKVELEIINFQAQKKMITFEKSSAQQIYEACVIVHNIYQHYSNLNQLKKIPIIKSPRIQFMVTLFETLLDGLVNLTTILDVSNIDQIEDAAKRFSLLVININKIICVLYVY